MSEWSLCDFSKTDEQVTSIVQVRAITDEDRDALSQANAKLGKLLGRTTFSVLSHNFRTFVATEHDLLGRLRSGHAGVQAGIQELRTTATAAVVNFLTSMRMFLDHCESELKRRDRSDSGTRFQRWKATCSAEYDDYFAYRFLYRFRNYIQHVGLPLSTITMSSSLNERGEIVGTVFLGEAPAHLVEDYEEWGAVGVELQGLGTDLDISEQIHVAMECLERIAQAMLLEDTPEILASFDVIVALVGDRAKYNGAPVLVEFTGETNNPIRGMQFLDIERLNMASHLARLVDPEKYAPKAH